jgi:DNA-binding NtrC family response regulator
MRAGGGSLVIESVLGKGTMVRLLFPPAPVARRAGWLLLLVEDETPVRSLAARALTRRGWEVLATDSAESALTAAESRLADLALVVADLSLPGGDGLGLIRTLRVRRPGLPAILTSGYLTVAAASDEPDLRLLSKPYDMETLAQACAEAVERS